LPQRNNVFVIELWIVDFRRAQIEGSLVPGKWVQGNCNVPYGGAEQIMSLWLG
jgi:hypothetical protein